MSVVSKNPFELLGDDGEERAPAAAPKAGKPAAAAQQPKVVPGAAPKGGRGARPARGAPRTFAAAEGGEGFEGERVAPPKKDHQGRDRHTKGPREDRSYTGPRSRAPGAAGARGPKGRAPRNGAPGAASAPAEKKTETWGNEEGKAELTAETQGEKEGAADAAAPVVEAEVEQEPEEVTKTLDQYFAEKASLSGVLAKKETRTVDQELEGKAFKREDDEDFFVGKQKESAKKEKSKKEKVFIPVDGQFRAERPPREQRGGERQGRGRGAPRGGARGAAAGQGRGQGRAPRQPVIDANDQSAFPALG